MFRSFYNANKVDYLSLPSFKSGKGPCRSLKGEVQIAIDVKLKFRFICLQIDTVMLPKMEFPWNLRFPVTVINNLYTWEKKMKYYVLISVKTISFLSLSKTSQNSPKWHEKWEKKGKLSDHLSCTCLNFDAAGCHMILSIKLQLPSLNGFQKNNHMEDRQEDQLPPTLI